LAISAALLAGCKRQAEVSLKRDGSPAEIVAQFTNLLAHGTTMDRVGAVHALETLAIESWDQDSKEIAVTALMRATCAPDTNVQKETWEALSRQFVPLMLPSWSSAAISNAAVHELSNSEAQICCAAANLLLRQDTRNQTAAAALFSLLAHPEAAVRLRAGDALTFEAERDALLKEQLQSHLNVLTSAQDRGVRFDAVDRYWRLTRKQSEFSAARLEAERTLLELLQSTDVQMRRKAADLLLDRGEGSFPVVSLPLQDFLQTGLADPDAQVAASIAHFFNQKFRATRNSPSSAMLGALSRALQDADPAVRLAALRMMRLSGNNRWWSSSKATKKALPDGSVREVFEEISVDPMILQPFTNALHDPDWNLRLDAAWTLLYLPALRDSLAPALHQVVIEGLESRDLSRRKSAVGLLSSLAWGFTNHPPRIHQLIQVAAEDSNWEVRRAALNFVGESRTLSSQIRLQILNTRCDDPAASVRVSVGNGLAFLAAEQGRGTNPPWSALPVGVLHLMNDPFPDVSLAGLIVLRHISAGTNVTPVVLEARDRLHQIAIGTNVSLKVRLARCYARVFNWGRPPDAEKNLQILAAAPESMVRRLAVATLNFLGLVIPPAAQTDSDPEVRNAASFVIPRLPALALSDNLETLLQKLKASDPVTCRKAALSLAGNEAARQKSGVAAEAVKVLLENYTNAPPSEFDSINRALRNLVDGSNYRTVQTSAVQMVLSDNAVAQSGAWPLLADFARRGQIDFPDDTLLRLATTAVQRTREPTLSIRRAALQMLPTLERALLGRVGPSNGIVAFQVRKSLVGALSDREPAVAIFAATPFAEGYASRTGGLIPLEAELSEQAALVMEARLADPQPDVRQIMASGLISLGSRQLNTNRVEKGLMCLEGLFARPERVIIFLSNYSFSEGIELPSGLYTLKTVAFCSVDSSIRRLAVQTLARLLDAVAEGGDFPISPFQEIANSIESCQPKAIEFEQLRNPLLKIAHGTNSALTDGAAILLGRFRPATEALPTGLVAQARSPSATERRQAILGLVEQKQNSSEHFREEASLLARQLTEDPDESVRIAALQALSSYLFPTAPNGPPKPISGSQTPIAVEPLIKALDDFSPEVKEAAFRILLYKLYVLPESNLKQLALPMLKRMMTIRDVASIPNYQHFGILAGHVKDPTVRQRILLDAQERIGRAENDEARCNWLKAIGSLHLAFVQPNEAAAAFQKSIRLQRNRDDSVLRDLEKALQSSGRVNETALEPAPRPNYVELQSQLRTLAGKKDVALLVQVANRALDGYLPAYGGRTLTHGFGEPDQVIRETSGLLLSLQKLDVLDEFLKGALKRYPESPEVAVGQARLYEAQDRKSEAVELLERELKQRDWNHSALVLLETLCKETRQPERYETLLRGLVEKHPAQDMFSRPMVELYIRTGRTNEASNVIAAFRAACESVSRNSGNPDFSKHPQYPWHQRTLSDLLQLSGDLNGAIAAQIEANKTTPDSQSLVFGQQRLEALYKQAGNTNAQAPRR